MVEVGVGLQFGVEVDQVLRLLVIVATLSMLQALVSLLFKDSSMSPDDEIQDCALPLLIAVLQAMERKGSS